MIRKKGFDTSRYLSAQIKRIMERVNQFDTLYLEFGGKLRYDHHASRVLPGFAVDTKVQMLKKLGNDIEIIHCISAKDIERRKIRRDFNSFKTLSGTCTGPGVNNFNCEPFSLLKCISVIIVSIFLLIIIFSMIL